MLLALLLASQFCYWRWRCCWRCCLRCCWRGADVLLLALLLAWC
jgi:hypothetical protein